MDSHERKRDKMKQIATARIAQSEKGIAHVVNDLSNPLGLTLNQRAACPSLRVLPMREKKYREFETDRRVKITSIAYAGTSIFWCTGGGRTGVIRVLKIGPVWYRRIPSEATMSLHEKTRIASNDTGIA